MEMPKYVAVAAYISTTLKMECSFQHFSVQYVFGSWNENVLRVKWGYFKKS